ncbi:hypothetical protein KIPB_007788 [Kipferlia bialata]|uniref:Uncharacterized protein n=1 Tax=Kipferlia bialata TaxID=797122 RepID=A0A9K3D0V1_9EUKA|nr:hypothetical protein KIPB_007788 [Kipferlia bialata]|eukprot:g7788.t1
MALPFVMRETVADLIFIVRLFLCVFFVKWLCDLFEVVGIYDFAIVVEDEGLSVLYQECMEVLPCAAALVVFTRHLWRSRRRGETKRLLT